MKQSPFQIILLVVAGIAIVIGVLLFAFNQRDSAQLRQGVTIWGTVPAVDVNAVIADILERDRNSINVTYQEFSRATFESELVERLATGEGPDIVLLPQDLIVQHENKFQRIPYDLYPERTFKDIFIEEGELFLHPEGITGIPFVVDPMVMYWNRTLFTRAGLSEPPREWGKILDIVPQLTIKDSSFAVTKSGVALGEFRNVTNAKEIFLTLLLQAGNPLIFRNVDDEDLSRRSGDYTVLLSAPLGYAVRPAEAALNFYTQFSNPAKAVYSWNRSLPSSQDMFVSGDLAIYFGFASEFDLMRKKNPTLNFDVALMPQSSNGALSTFANMHSFAITRTTKNFDSALYAITRLTEPESIAFLSERQFLPPVRRDLLRGQNDNAVMTVLYNAALRSKGVYDLDPEETESIFQDMVESYVTGRSSAGEAITDAEDLLNSIAQ